MNSKSVILHKIRKALEDNPIASKAMEERLVVADVFSDKKKQDLRLLFAEQFSAIGGYFSYVAGAQEVIPYIQKILAEHTPEDRPLRFFSQRESLLPDGVERETNILQADVAITGCAHLIARTGSVVMSSEQDRMDTVATPIHIVISGTNKLVFDLEDIFQNQLPPVMSIVSGSSRTADIEKTLVIGAHGTKYLYVCLVQEQVEADR